MKNDKTYILDACALIAFFNDENGADVVEDLLIRANANHVSLIMNIINILEIYYGVCREDGMDMADILMQKIENLPITIIDALSDEVFREAGKLKATCRISLADAIALAEANVRMARIVTADHHEFDELENSGKISPYWIR